MMPSFDKNDTLASIIESIEYALLGWERIHLQCRKPSFNLWIRKIPWRREWLPTPVFLLGEFQGQRSLVGYNPWGCKESDTTEKTKSTSLEPLVAE